jgi:uncharacterized protein YdaU (DUF1376 family)
MNQPWYPRYPSDYARDTGHLSLAEDGAFSRLLDAYYTKRGPFLNEMEGLYRIARAMSRVERQAVQRVVREFFVVRDGMLHNNRADAVLRDMEGRYRKRAEAGAKGGKAKSERPAIGKPPPSVDVAMLEQCPTQPQPHIHGDTEPPNPQGGLETIPAWLSELTEGLRGTGRFPNLSVEGVARAVRSAGVYGALSEDEVRGMVVEAGDLPGAKVQAPAPWIRRKVLDLKNKTGAQGPGGIWRGVTGNERRQARRGMGIRSISRRGAEAQRGFGGIVSDSKTKHDAMVKVNGLHRQKAALCQRKAEIQTQLSALTAEVRGKRVAPRRYEGVCREQEDLKSELAGIERQVIALTSEIRELSVEANAPDKDAPPNRKVIIPVLVALRDEYEAFAADGTRVSSMRRMAAEFSMKLTRIIREM